MRKAIYSLIAILCLCISASAQYGGYSFINGEANRIEGGNLEYAYSKLDSIIRGDTCSMNILHLGGSHVEAGVLTYEIRKQLDSASSNIRSSFCAAFPYTSARMNTPVYYKTHYKGTWTADKSVKSVQNHRLGLMGLAVTAKDTSSFVSIVTIPRAPFRGDSAMFVNKVKILGTAKGDFRPVIMHGADTVFAVSDSLGYDFTLPEPSDSILIRLAGTNGEFTISGAFLYDTTSNFSISGAGINGASLVAYSRCADLQRDLSLIKPDLVICAIGINDAIATNFSPDVFKARYSVLIGQIKAANPDCSIIFMSNNDSCRRIRRKGYVTNQNGPVVEKAFAELAKEYDAGYWDLFKIMGGLGSMRKWESAGLCKRDKVHFTDAGYKLIGDMFSKAFLDRYNDYLKSENISE